MERQAQKGIINLGQTQELLARDSELQIIETFRR